MGYDVKSVPLWVGYIDFLKSIPIETESEKKAKEDTIRLGYERALSLPLANINTLGRQYEQFLMSTISSKAEVDMIIKHSNRTDVCHSLVCKVRDKHMSFKEPLHNDPKKSSSQLPQLRMSVGSDCDFPAPFPIMAKQYNWTHSNANLALSGSGSVYDNSSHSSSSFFSSQRYTPPTPAYTKIGSHFDPWVGYWRNVLNYERSNQQRVQFNVLRARVIFSFKKAMPYCLHSIHYWYDFVTFLQEELNKPIGGGGGNSLGGVEVSLLESQHTTSGSTLYGLDTIYGNGFIDYTNDESAIKAITGLLNASAAIQKSITTLNPKHEKEQVQKSVFYSIAQRLYIHSTRIQALIYHIWELGLKFMGYSMLYRQVYVSYLIKRGLPADTFISQQISTKLIPNLEKAADGDVIMQTKAELYRQLNREITTRAEQLLFTTLIEAEHDNSIGSSMPFQLPYNQSDYHTWYHDWRHVYGNFSQPINDLIALITASAQSNGAVKYENQVFEGSLAVSSATIQSNVSGNDSMGSDERQQAQLPAIFTPIGTITAKSVLLTKEDAHSSEVLVQVEAPPITLNINTSLQPLPISTSSILFTFSPKYNNYDNAQVNNDKTSLQPRLYSTVVNILPFRTSIDTIDEYPTLAFLEFKRLSCDFNTTIKIWTLLRKTTSIRLFNEKAYLYICEQFSLRGTSEQKSKIPMLFTKAKETLVESQRMILEQRFKSELSIAPSIYQTYIEKLLLTHELTVIYKHLDYLEQKNDIIEAKNLISSTLQNKYLLSDPDFVPTFTRLYHKLLRLIVLIGGSDTFNDGSTTGGNDASTIVPPSPCFIQLNSMQQKRAIFLNQVDVVNILHPLETGTQNSQQLQLQLMGVNTPSIQPPGAQSGQISTSIVQQQRGATAIQHLLASSVGSQSSEAQLTTPSFLDTVEPLGSGGMGTVEEYASKSTVVPLEGAFEVMSAVFPDYFSTVTDPITMTTFKNLSTVLPPSQRSYGVGNVAGDVTMTGAGNDFAEILTGGVGDDDEMDIESRTVSNHLNQPMTITPDNTSRSRNNFNQQSGPMIYHRAPILKKLSFDEQRVAARVFTMPNLQKFTPYDPRVHTKLAFPNQDHYDHMVNQAVMKKEIVTVQPNDGSNQETLKLNLTYVDADDKTVTTTVLRQSPTFPVAETAPDQIVNPKNKQHKALTTIQVHNISTSHYNQTYNKTPYIGLIHYNHFGILAKYFSPQTAFSSQFLFLYKNSIAQTRSMQEILPQLPALHFRDVFNYSLIKDDSAGAQQERQTKQAEHAFKIEQQKAYDEIQSGYMNETRSMDRRATFVLLNKAVGTPGNQILVPPNQDQFSLENVADIIISSIMKATKIAASGSSQPINKNNMNNSNNNPNQQRNIGGPPPGGNMNMNTGPSGMNNGPPRPNAPVNNFPPQQQPPQQQRPPQPMMGGPNPNFNNNNMNFPPGGPSGPNNMQRPPPQMMGNNSNPNPQRPPQPQGPGGQMGNWNPNFSRQ
jgi:hypothetical protein